MTVASRTQEVIDSFCSRCAGKLSGVTEPKEFIEYFRKELPSLLLDKPLFLDMIQDVVQGAGYPNLQQVTMFDNEFVLYANPDRLFSLRLFLWEPGEYTSVHDHGSWGVIGPVTGGLEVVKYRREDDGSKDDFARLVESERFTLQPGETSYTLPLNEGIHKTGNPGDRTMVSLSLYGNPLPRGYVNGFDLETNRVYRILPPKTRKKLLAIQALAGLDAKLGKEAIEKAHKHPLEVFRTVAPDGGGKLT